jgi:hypothetical protein
VLADHGAQPGAGGAGGVGGVGAGGAGGGGGVGALQLAVIVHGAPVPLPPLLVAGSLPCVHQLAR